MGVLFFVSSSLVLISEMISSFIANSFLVCYLISESF